MKSSSGSSAASMEMRTVIVWVWFSTFKEEKGKRRNTGEKRRPTV